MADPKQHTKESMAASAEAAPPGPGGITVDADVDVKKRKRKYSRGLRDPQKWERGYSKAVRRVGRAVASGLDTYVEKRDKSSFKRRDGAVRDALKNWSKALSKTINKSGKATSDLANGFDTKSVRRAVKQVVRVFSSPFVR